MPITPSLTEVGKSYYKNLPTYSLLLLKNNNNMYNVVKFLTFFPDQETVMYMIGFYSYSSPCNNFFPIYEYSTMPSEWSDNVIQNILDNAEYGLIFDDMVKKVFDKE